jgi:hypothetical protein
MTDTTVYMLTTVDNPWDPFTHFDEWNTYDMMMGYHTCSYLARIAKSSEDLSEPDQVSVIQNAIDSILEENVSGMWIKVAENGGREMSTRGEGV